LTGCKNENSDSPQSAKTTEAKESTPYQDAVAHPYIEFKGMTVEDRFKPPKGYVRLPKEDDSFGTYLRKLPLKPPGSPVMLYDGKEKQNQVHEAVYNLKIGNKDLHQCADALMRLWADHNWMQGKYEQIEFNLTNGFKVPYIKWANGERPKIEGNQWYWYPQNEKDYTYHSFWKYLELIWMYAGTLSLEKELSPVSITEIEIGDLFIQGGSPGHSIIVADMVEDPKSGNKLMLLAQSYMPAQELHILKNSSSTMSPWYSIPRDVLYTPEWEFEASDLRRFGE